MNRATRALASSLRNPAIGCESTRSSFFPSDSEMVSLAGPTTAATAKAPSKVGADRKPMATATSQPTLFVCRPPSAWR